MEPATQITELNHDIFAQHVLLPYLTVGDLIRYLSTCTQLYFTGEKLTCWKAFCVRDFHLPEDKDLSNWKELYFQTSRQKHLEPLLSEVSFQNPDLFQWVTLPLGKRTRKLPQGIEPIKSFLQVSNQAIIIRYDSTKPSVIIKTKGGHFYPYYPDGSHRVHPIGVSNDKHDFDIDEMNFDTCHFYNVRPTICSGTVVDTFEEDGISFCSVLVDGEDDCPIDLQTPLHCLKTVQPLLDSGVYEVRCTVYRLLGVDLLVHVFGKTSTDKSN